MWNVLNLIINSTDNLYPFEHTVSDKSEEENNSQCGTHTHTHTKNTVREYSMLFGIC